MEKIEFEYKPTDEEIEQAKKNLCRINELRAKKETLKSGRLGKKESQELRELVDGGCACYIFYAWSPIAQKELEELFERADVTYNKHKMPDSVNLKFF